MKNTRTLRSILILTGLILVGLAFMAEWLGLSKSSGMSTGKTLLLLFGIATGTLGVLGQRSLKIYQSTAIILLNTIVFLMLIELVATTLLRYNAIISSDITSIHPAAQSTYYLENNWGKAYWKELNTSWSKEYHPYIIWRRPSFIGDHINIDDNSLRITPNSECGKESYLIFAFGGSTMWGYGAPDWGTIPAYLQLEISKSVNIPICILNFGESGYVSTQSLIALILELQSDNVPDLVIFYDGINDTFAAYQSNEGGVHQNFERIAARFNEDANDKLIDLLSDSNTISILNSILSKQTKDDLPDKDYNTSELSDIISKYYIKNYDIVEILAIAYGFDYLFFWQPSIWAGDKPLTSEEETIYSSGIENIPEVDQLFVNQLYIDVYKQIFNISSFYDNLYYIGDVFDEVDLHVWIDNMHITPEGNKIIAQVMLRAIREHQMLPN